MSKLILYLYYLFHILLSFTISLSFSVSYVLLFSLSASFAVSPHPSISFALSPFLAVSFALAPSPIVPVVLLCLQTLFCLLLISHSLFCSLSLSLSTHVSLIISYSQVFLMKKVVSGDNVVSLHCLFALMKKEYAYHYSFNNSQCLSFLLYFFLCSIPPLINSIFALRPFT